MTAVSGHGALWAASSDGAEVVRCEATGSDGAVARMLQAANEGGGERERE